MLCLLLSAIFADPAEIQLTNGMAYAPNTLKTPAAHPALPPSVSIERALENDSHVRLTFEFVDRGSGPMPEANKYRCMHTCNGNVHDAHAKCDSSCDQPCPQMHGTASASVIHYPIPGQSPRFGHMMLGMSPGEYLATSATESEVRSYRSRDLYRDLQSQLLNAMSAFCQQAAVSFSPACWETRPCSFTTRSFQYRRYELIVRGSFYKLEGTAKKGIPGEPPIQFDFGSLYVPERVFAVVDSATRCGCNPRTSLLDNKFQQFPTSGTPTGLPTSTPGVFAMIGRDVLALPGQAFDALGCSLVVQNMNAVAMILGSSVPEGTRICMNPGTVLEPLDPEYQAMMVLERVAISNQDRLLASLEPTFQRTKNTARIICLDIAKKEPDGKAQYRIGSSNDPNLENLAAFSSRDMVKGLYDQTRFWIARDGATAEEIRRRLSSNVRDGDYLTSLYEAVRYGRLDISAGKYSKCLNPELLLGRSASAESTEWASEELAKKRWPSFKSWFESKRKTFESALKEDSTDATGKHVAAIAAGCMASGNGEAAIYFVEVILSAPKAVAAILSSPRFGSELIRWIRAESDEGRLNRLLDLCAFLGPKAGYLPLVAVPASAPESVRKRAVGILASWKPSLTSQGPIR